MRVRGAPSPISRAHARTLTICQNSVSLALVTGQSAAELPHATHEGGLVSVPGVGGVMDGRVSTAHPMSRASRELPQTISKILERSGPAAREVAEQAEVFGALFRAELQSLAGSELPPSVTAQAQMAINGMATLYRAELLAGAAFGDWSEAYLDRAASNALNERADKSQRNLAGLAIVARDLLLAARAAAKEVRQGQGSATDGLMSALGVTRRPVESSASSPPLHPGGVEKSGTPTPNPIPSQDSGGTK
jgi:hypothetical protein